MNKIREIIERVMSFVTDFIDKLKSDRKTLLLTIVILLVAILIVFSKVKIYFNNLETDKTAENAVGVLTPLLGDPENNTFYTKTGETTYETCLGTSNFTDVAKKADNTRIKWYTVDDTKIPTVYKDDLILYYTKETIPTSFTWERFEDLGYTVGVGVLSSNEAGKYQFEIQKKETLDKYVNKESSASQYFTKDEEGATYIVDRIDTVKVSSDNISDGGTITGLNYGQAYTVDLYEGTNYTPAEMIADTHAFSSYELYESAKYGFLQEGYVSITVPENLISGYYTINNGGIFRYVDNTRDEGIAGVDFNKAYYIGVAEDGTVITLDNKSDYTSKEDLTESNECYRYSLYLDDTNAQFDIDVTFNEMINFVENEDADKPIEIVLIGPDGSKYDLTESERKDNTFTTTVVGPDVGTWYLKAYNTGDKYFEVNEALTSNQADYVNQSGTSKATMKIDLEEDYTDGTFAFTWENTNRAADILIIAPDGSKYGKSVNANDVISESYGKMSISVPNAKAGNYTIEINGEDLGKVRFYNESVVTSPDAEVSSTDNPIESLGQIEEITQE